MLLPAGAARVLASVLVVMPVVSGVQVPVVGVVDMLAVGEGLVPAARLVFVTVVIVGGVRQRVLVIVAVMPGVGVAVMNVVGVIPVRHAGVPALGTVLVPVPGVNVVLGTGHLHPARPGHHSVLWRTASATI